MGKDATPLKGEIVYGLIVILLGLVAYRVGAQLKRKPEGEGMALLPNGLRTP